MKLRFTITTDLDLAHQDVFKAFDRQLFEALLPSFGGVELLRFDGSKPGDIVHLRFTKPFKSEWVSEITDLDQSGDNHYFIDEGRKLPFGLKYWRHKHIVRKKGVGTSTIIDDITYGGRFWIWTILLYPVLYLAFMPRKWLYRKYFKQQPEHVK